MFTTWITTCSEAPSILRSSSGGFDARPAGLHPLHVLLVLAGQLFVEAWVLAASFLVLAAVPAPYAGHVVFSRAVADEAGAGDYLQLAAVLQVAEAEPVRLRRHAHP